MSFDDIYKLVKSEYCNLFNYKVHGNGRTLEIITPNIGINDKFVSIFLTMRDSSFIITDGGWVDSNSYGSDYFGDDAEMTENLVKQFVDYYNIRIAYGLDKKQVFYKETRDKKFIPALVFDMANFISNIINIHSLELKDKRDKEERDKFKVKTNDFLKNIYKDKFKSRQEISGVKFNGVITISNTIHLVEYITGSSRQYFENDLRKAAVNFNIVDNSKYKLYLGQKIAILNSKSVGYGNNPSIVLMKYLQENITHDFLTWDNKEQISSIISPN